MDKLALTLSRLNESQRLRYLLDLVSEFDSTSQPFGHIVLAAREALAANPPATIEG